MSLEECVYACRHPLWGGEGNCIVDDGDPNVGDTCSCDAGFASRNSYGDPSCVPTRVLVVGYLILAMVGAAIGIFLGCSAHRYRRLPTQVKASRRALLRLRVSFPASMAIAVSTLVFIIAAGARGNISLLDNGMVQTLYTLYCPLANFAVVSGMELWVDFLPSQLLPPGSMAIRLKEFTEARRVFYWAAVISTGIFGLLGLATFDFNPGIVVTAIHFLSAVSAAFMGGFVLFVAANLTGIITGARAKATPSVQAIYRRAKRTLWLQVSFLCGSVVLWVLAVLALELTNAGRNTPFIPFSLMFVDAYVCFGALIYFSSSCKMATKHVVHPGASMPRHGSPTTARTVLPTWRAVNKSTRGGRYIDGGAVEEVTMTVSIGFKADSVHTQRIGGGCTSGGRTALVVPMDGEC